MPAVRYATLRNFNLNGNLKSKYLDVKATQVDVIIELDSELDALIKAGKESLKIGHLGDVAKAELEKASKAFIATIADLDRKLESLALDPLNRDSKVKEANEVLKHYAKIVEANANLAVQKEWQGYLARQKHLSKFRVKCVLKITLGSIGVGIAVASAVMSFGTLWMNVVAAAKGVTDLMQTIKTWSQDIDAVYKDLLKQMETVHKLNLEREKKKKSSEGQKLSKTKEGLKELTNAILPITKSMVKATSEIENTCKQFLGLVAKLENKADDLVGQLNKLVSYMTKLPDKSLSAELKKLVNQMDSSFQSLFQKITTLHKRAQQAGKFGDRALKATQKLRKEDSWGPVDAESTLDMGKHAISAYAVANFIFQCAYQGKALIPL